MSARTIENYEPADNLLEGRLVMVTGAGDGIGKAAAVSYAAHGASVILLGKTIKKLEKVYDEIEAAGYPEAVILPLDLQGATAADYATVAERIEEDFGRLDGLLHNAGVLGDLTPLEHYDPETWNKVMQVNLTAEFLLTRSMIPLLRASGDSSVVFTSSSVGRKGRAHWGPMLCRSLRPRGLWRRWRTRWMTSVTVCG